MSHHLLQDSRFYALLLQIDQDLAAQVRRRGCSCGGRLHCGNYPRKPRGPTFLNNDAAWEKRLSLCCGRCRKRATPPSVRFAGRRVYAAVVVVLGCLYAGKAIGRAELDALRNAVGVSPRTVGRWLSWWRRHFVQTGLWILGRARFMPPINEAELPASLLARFSGDNATALTAVLRFLAPLTSNTAHAA